MIASHAFPRFGILLSLAQVVTVPLSYLAVLLLGARGGRLPLAVGVIALNSNFPPFNRKHQLYSDHVSVLVPAVQLRVVAARLVVISLVRHSLLRGAPPPPPPPPRGVSPSPLPHRFALPIPFSVPLFYIPHLDSSQFAFFVYNPFFFSLLVRSTPPSHMIVRVFGSSERSPRSNLSCNAPLLGKAQVKNVLHPRLEFFPFPLNSSTRRGANVDLYSQ